MTERTARIKRVTKETDIVLHLNLDGTGISHINTGIGFFDHMMEGFARHGFFDLDLKVKGDLHVDCHHTIEDTGIVLGEAIRQALGSKVGIRRYGHVILPMDETLMLCAADISGRDCLGFQVEFPAAKVGNFDTELVKEFYLGFVRKAGITLHFRELAGENTHHIIEAMFKAFGRTMAQAVKIEEGYQDEIPSTKGIL